MAFINALTDTKTGKKTTTIPGALTDTNAISNNTYSTLAQLSGATNPSTLSTKSYSPSGGTSTTPAANTKAGTAVSDVSSVTDPTPAITSTATTGSGDIIQTAEDAAAAEKARQLSALRSKLDMALGGLDSTLNSNLANIDTAQTGVGNFYYGKRNEAAGTSDVNAMNFATRAAAQGIKGSAAMQPEIYRANALQNALTSLNKSEGEAKTNFETQRMLATNNAEVQRNALNQAYNSDVESVNSGVESDLMQMKLEQLIAAQSRQDQLTQQGLQNSLNAAQITGDFSSLSTYGWTPEMIASATTQWKASNTPKTSYSYSGGTAKTAATASDSGILSSMLSKGSDAAAYEYLVGLGLSQSKTDQLYEFYEDQKSAAASKTGAATSTATTTAPASAEQDWTTVPGIGRVSYPELLAMVERGAVIETLDPATGTYRYRKA